MDDCVYRASNEHAMQLTRTDAAAIRNPAAAALSGKIMPVHGSFVLGSSETHTASRCFYAATCELVSRDCRYFSLQQFTHLYPGEPI